MKRLNLKRRKKNMIETLLKAAYESLNYYELSELYLNEKNKKRLTIIKPILNKKWELLAIK